MLQRFKPLKNNLFLTLLFYVFTAGGQVLYYSLHESLNLQIPPAKFLSLFVILFIFSFIKQKPWRYLSMSFIYFLSFFQMVHLEFYGLPVHASEIYLLFTQGNEILGTLKEDFYIFVVPSLIVIPGMIILWWANSRFVPAVKTKFLYLLFIFYFLYNPGRTYATGNTWGRQPSTEEFDGMNIYISLSYFLGKILPYKIRSSSVAESGNNIIFERKNISERNIIVIQGESVTPNHMSLFGYQRETTPFLKSLKNDARFIWRRGISAGVSTDISVAFFMNNAFGLNGNQSVFKAKNCLFKLAKENDFETFFYSTQSQQQLRYITNSICPRYIDHYKNLKDISPELEDENLADDHKLVDELTKLDLSRPGQFILLHQRGSHSPYSKRFNQFSDKFTHSSAENIKEKQVNYYDNSIFHLDLFMEKLITLVQTSKVPTTIFYVSDHGEGLGEDGIWGHGLLNQVSFEIPILIYVHNDPDHQNFLNQLDETPTHLNVSLLISEAMGYKANYSSFKTPNQYTILGNDMDGFAGFLDLKFEEGKLKSFTRRDI